MVSAPMLPASLAAGLESRRFVTAALGAALVLRLCWVALVPVSPTSNCKWYFDLAASLAEGRGFAIDERPTAFYPVGYPAFLAALFTLAGPSLLAVYPNFIAHTALTSSESLFTASLLLAVFAQLKALDRASPSVTALAGLAFGVAALIKPQAAPVPVLIWALGRAWMPVPRPRRLVMLGILCVAMAVPLSAWMVRNYRVFGIVFFVSSNAGVNLLIGNNPAATGKYLPLEVFPDDSGPAPEQWLDREALRLALDFMTRHPMAALQIYRSPVPFPADAVGGHVRCLAHQPRLVRSTGLW